MKKLSIIAITLMIGTSMAFASSLAIPWFADNAPVDNGIPGASPGTTCLVVLKSNVVDADTGTPEADPIVCWITYYNAAGDDLGPAAPDNTFAINPLSALSFRPVQDDPGGSVAGGTSGGQEGGQGVLVPNRPRDVDTKKNGSAVIEWVGEATDVQGQIAFLTTGSDTTVTVSYAHLLPPGV